MKGRNIDNQSEREVMKKERERLNKNILQFFRYASGQAQSLKNISMSFFLQIDHAKLNLASKNASKNEIKGFWIRVKNYILFFLSVLTVKTKIVFEYFIIGTL